MRIFVTGASGFVGRRLLRELLRRGDHVLALSRHAANITGVASDLAGNGGAEQRLTVLQGDPTKAGPWQQRIAECDAVVALAGEPVMGARWTADFKRRLYDSRIEGLRRINEAMANASAMPSANPGKCPRVLVSASAVGYYGMHGREPLTESSKAGTDFLAGLCVDWEAAAEAAKAQGVRVVTLRIGVVLGEGGGALEKMLPAFRAFVGGPLGSGEQFVPWVHLDDVLGLILLALEKPEAHGPINAVAPEPATMRELALQLGRTLQRPTLFSVPETALKLMLGERAQVLLGSQQVVPQRARELGYRFKHEDLASAVRAVLGRTGKL